MSRTHHQARPGVGKEDVMQAVITYTRQHGWPPSIDDIRRLTGHQSRSTVKEHLVSLELDGRIVRGSGPRMIRVVRP